MRRPRNVKNRINLGADSLDKLGYKIRAEAWNRIKVVTGSVVEPPTWAVETTITREADRTRVEE